MSGETEDRVSGWTVDTLKEYFQKQLDMHAQMLNERYATQTKALDAAFKAAEQAVQTALVSAEKAVAKAETAAEKRFEGVNEFRGQLTDQAATFMTRREYDAKHEALESKVVDAMKRLDVTQGRSSGSSATTATFLAVGAIVVTIVIAVVTVILSR